jgi:SAM-dependent methyltransferase
MPYQEIAEQVDRFFRGRLLAHGPTPGGVDWNSVEAQRARFAQLLRICDRSRPFSLTDFGCGYGALVPYLFENQYPVHYRGYDICQDMIHTATQLHGPRSECVFVSDPEQLEPGDYTVASGVLNLRFTTPLDDWQQYVLYTLDQMDRLSRRGFAFNMLTSYSEPERMRPDLYYADPCFYFHHCKMRYSRQVALLHDYGYYDFTILVRK